MPLRHSSTLDANNANARAPPIAATGAVWRKEGIFRERSVLIGETMARRHPKVTREENSVLFDRRFGSMVTTAAPAKAPHWFRRPPKTTPSNSITIRSYPKAAGCRYPKFIACNAPASPAKALPQAKASILWRRVPIPRASVAVGESRKASIASPKRDRSKSCDAHQVTNKTSRQSQ